MLRTGPTRSQLIAQILKQQSQPMPAQVQSYGEGFARLGSRLVDALSAKMQAEELMKKEAAQRQTDTSALQAALSGGYLGETDPVTGEVISPEIAPLTPQAFGRAAATEGLSPDMQSMLLQNAMMRQQGGVQPAQVQAFEYYQNVLNDPNASDTQKQAAGVALGVTPRAGRSQAVDIGGVKYNYDPTTGEYKSITVGDQVLGVEEQAETEGVIAGTKERGKQEQAQAVKMIGDTVEQIGKIKTGLSNYDEGIRLLEQEGASTGVIENLLPSFRASTIELENVQSRLGLDVIGSVTFGALSEGELNLALTTAIPMTLEPQELAEWLKSKKQAQEKLMGYYMDQVDYLRQPNATVAGWVAEQRAIEEQQVTELPQGTIDNGDGTFTLPDGTIIRKKQ